MCKRQNFYFNFLLLNHFFQLFHGTNILHSYPHAIFNIQHFQLLSFLAFSFKAYIYTTRILYHFGARYFLTTAKIFECKMLLSFVCKNLSKTKSRGKIVARIAKNCVSIEKKKKVENFDKT